MSAWHPIPISTNIPRAPIWDVATSTLPVFRAQPDRTWISNSDREWAEERRDVKVRRKLPLVVRLLDERVTTRQNPYGLVVRSVERPPEPPWKRTGNASSHRLSPRKGQRII